MKAAALFVPVLMIAFLVGCNEESHLTSPVATPSSPAVTQGINGPHPELTTEKIDRIVVGFDGVKYVVRGTVEFSLAMRQSAYTLQTSVSVNINQSGSDNNWTVSGEGYFNSELYPGEQGASFVAETHQFESMNKIAAPFSLYLEYRVDDGGVVVNDIKVLTSDAQ